MNKDYQMQFSAQNKLDIVRQTQFLTGRRQGRLNQRAHWARAQGAGYFFFFLRAPTGCGEINSLKLIILLPSQR